MTRVLLTFTLVLLMAGLTARAWASWLRRPKIRWIESPPASGRYTAKGLPAALSHDDLRWIARLHDPLIVGLFAELPEPDTLFPQSEDWLALARLVLPQVYHSKSAAPVLRAASTLSEASGVGNEPDAGAA